MHDNAGDQHQQGKEKRRYNIRGSQAAPRKKSTLKKQMVVTEDGDDVFCKLPGAKTKQPKNKHNVMEAVKKAFASGLGPLLLFHSDQQSVNSQ